MKERNLYLFKVIKKVSIFVLVFVLSISFVPTEIYAATDTSSVTLTVDTSTITDAKVGETINVPVKLVMDSKSPGVGALQMTIKYDPNQLEYDSTNSIKGNLIKNYYDFSITLLEPGAIKLMGIDNSDDGSVAINDDGNLAILAFKVKQVIGMTYPNSYSIDIDTTSTDSDRKIIFSDHTLDMKDLMVNATNGSVLVKLISHDATVTAKAGSNYAVDSINNTITNIPYGTSLATFKDNIVKPTNGDFEVYPSTGTNPATDLRSGYRVVATAEDGTTVKTYTIDINKNTGNDILGIEFNGDGLTTVSAVYSTVYSRWEATVPFGTNVAKLVPTISISPDATITPASGAEQDFRSDVTYTVKSQSGIDKAYKVKVIIAKNTVSKITAFSFNGLTPAVEGNIDETNKIITLNVPFGTDLTALVPTISLSPEATVNPASETPCDFSNKNGVSYIVTAGDGTTTTTYTVKVTSGKDSKKEITNFSFGIQGERVASITGTDINVTVPYLTDIKALTPHVTLNSTNATIIPEDYEKATDYSSPVTYTVKAQDGSEKVYTVRVTVDEPKPFIVNDLKLTGEGFIKATANVSKNTEFTGTYTGDKLVVFELMKADTPVGVTLVQGDLTSGIYGAGFNVDGNASNYSLKVFVVSRFGSNPNDIGELLAPVATK